MALWFSFKVDSANQKCCSLQKWINNNHHDSYTNTEPKSVIDTLDKIDGINRKFYILKKLIELKINLDLVTSRRKLAA